MSGLNKRSAVRWAVRLLLWSFVITIVLTLASTRAMSNAGLLASLAVLLVFILLGLAFDIFGVAAATASEKPFHSMSSRRVAGAREALRFVRNADRVASFCNDMVGDICSIICGACSATIVTVFIRDFSFSVTATTLIVSGFLGGVTVGLKAFCKPVAMRYNTQIVLAVGRAMYAIKRVVKYNDGQ